MAPPCGCCRWGGGGVESQSHTLNVYQYCTFDVHMCVLYYFIIQPMRHPQFKMHIEHIIPWSHTDGWPNEWRWFLNPDTYNINLSSAPQSRSILFKLERGPTINCDQLVNLVPCLSFPPCYTLLSQLNTAFHHAMAVNWKILLGGYLTRPKCGHNEVYVTWNHSHLDRAHTDRT